MTILQAGDLGGRPFSTAQDVFDESYGWRYRIIRASLGTTTGMIVLAMLAKTPRTGPAILGTADILWDGTVEVKCRVPSVGGPITRYMIIGTIEAVRDNVRRLADHCKLSDVDREAVFEELRKWIRKDFRARSEN